MLIYTHGQTFTHGPWYHNNTLSTFRIQMSKNDYTFVELCIDIIQNISNNVQSIILFKVTVRLI